MASETFTGGEDESFIESVQSDFTTLAWVLIPVGIGLNLAGSFVVQILRLPLFLDTIGTLLLAMLAGPWVAAVAGILTNLLKGVITSPTSMPFAITQLGIALVAGWLGVKGYYKVSELKEYWKLIVAGVVVAAVSTIISTPIIVLVFGGVTGGTTDAVIAFFLATGSGLVEAVLSEQAIISPTDKIASLLVAFWIAQGLPERYRPSFGQRVLPGSEE